IIVSFASGSDPTPKRTRIYTMIRQSSHEHSIESDHSETGEPSSSTSTDTTRCHGQQMAPIHTDQFDGGTRLRSSSDYDSQKGPTTDGSMPQKVIVHADVIPSLRI